MKAGRSLTTIIFVIAIPLLLILSGLLFWQMMQPPPEQAARSAPVADTTISQPIDIDTDIDTATPIATTTSYAPTPTAEVVVAKVAVVVTPIEIADNPKTRVQPAATLQPAIVVLPTNTPSPIAPATATLPPSATIAPPPPSAPMGSYSGEPVPILMYHHIAIPPADADEIRVGLSVYPDSFAASLDYLAANGYHTITLARYVDYLQALQQGGAPVSLPAKPVILSFDDGYSDIYANAYPLLKARGMVGTFFIISGKVGWDEYMTWEQLRQMSATGMDIESHTVNHLDLTGLDEATLRDELVTSKQQLETNLGQPITLLCYPAGTYNTFVQQIAQQAGYRASTTTEYGWADSSSDLFALPRVRMWEGAAISGSIP